MHFLIDDKNKIIFGWSGKCGCSHVKKIFWYFQNGSINNPIHTIKDTNLLPTKIFKYHTIIFCRNPYKRLVSGFLDKYHKNGEQRYKWTRKMLTFEMFVDELIKKDWNMIDYHHFVPQTEEKFDSKISTSKIIIYFDIENIDYEYLETLYQKKIPDELLNFRGKHIRQNFPTELKDKLKQNISNIKIDTYYNFNVDYKDFYRDKNIKDKVYQFYINDFKLFKQFNYDI